MLEKNNQLYWTNIHPENKTLTVKEIRFQVNIKDVSAQTLDEVIKRKYVHWCTLTRSPSFTCKLLWAALFIWIQPSSTSSEIKQIRTVSHCFFTTATIMRFTWGYVHFIQFNPQCLLQLVLSQLHHPIHPLVSSPPHCITNSPFNSYVGVLFHHKYTTQFISQLEAEYLDAIDNVKAKIQNKKLSC